MKKIFTLLFLTIIALGVKAQLVAPITFEDGGNDSIWIEFANGNDGNTRHWEITENPDKTGINQSDSVMMFTVLDDATTYVGFYTDSIGSIEFTDEAHTLTIMIMKNVSTKTTVKMERPFNSGAVTSVDVVNNLTDQWELLTFDMTPCIGYGYDRFTFFPDHVASPRTQGCVAYIDNIANATAPTSIANFKQGRLQLFPNPVENRMAVQFPGMTNIRISDLLGKTIRTFEYSKSNGRVLELSDLHSGIYFLTVDSDSGSHTVKFLKK
ncbi:MAG: T9SS type A sorting domain-containing protein [Bacteroidales bacterium]|nr:T9SS type A sorting domain-containing protein [Bacteroidales bacterium]MCB8999379.1 T9SS type A sorting domain-containing protein [Bacteroidales bacterium]MCB9013378.1 T9SS type A sorting domain-containing protein [Bacteroidales bacterium]